jgi:hypothetical protein
MAWVRYECWRGGLCCRFCLLQISGDNSREWVLVPEQPSEVGKGVLVERDGVFQSARCLVGGGEVVR